MNKNILIITPFFPPQTHAAVFRAVTTQHPYRKLLVNKA